MTEMWYYAKHGRRFGPFAFEQLRQMAASGLLSPDDMVWNGEGTQWTSASAVEGLLDLGPPSIGPGASSASPLDEPARPDATRQVVGWDDRAVWSWGVFLVAADISILQLCICVWFGLDYSRLLWFPSMTLAVVLAGLAFAVAGVCSLVFCTKDRWSPQRV